MSNDWAKASVKRAKVWAKEDAKVRLQMQKERRETFALQEQRRETVQGMHDFFMSQLQSIQSAILTVSSIEPLTERIRQYISLSEKIRTIEHQARSITVNKVVKEKGVSGFLSSDTEETEDAAAIAMAEMTEKDLDKNASLLPFQIDIKEQTEILALFDGVDEDDLSNGLEEYRTKISKEVFSKHLHTANAEFQNIISQTTDLCERLTKLTDLSVRIISMTGNVEDKEDLEKAVQVIAQIGEVITQLPIPQDEATLSNVLSIIQNHSKPSISKNERVSFAGYKKKIYASEDAIEQYHLRIRKDAHEKQLRLLNGQLLKCKEENNITKKLISFMDLHKNVSEARKNAVDKEGQQKTANILQSIDEAIIQLELPQDEATHIQILSSLQKKVPIKSVAIWRKSLAANAREHFPENTQLQDLVNKILGKPIPEDASFLKKLFIRIGNLFR